MAGREQQHCWEMVRRMWIPGLGAIRTLSRAPEFRERPLTTIGRAAAWSMRRRLGRQQAIPIAGSRLRVALPNDWWSWNHFVFRERRPTELELLWLLEQLENDMVAVDVGAHYGTWMAMMGDAVGPGGRVVAFEPTKSTMAVLKSTLELNQMTQVTAIQSAVSDRSGEASLHLKLGSPDMNSFGPVGKSSEMVRVVTLDEVLTAEGIHRVDALKVDTEGNEELVFRGATSLLRRHHPIVVFEVNPSATEAMRLRPEGAWQFLVEIGYEIYRLDERGRLVHLPTFTAPSEGEIYWNAIAVMPE
jgi:FkbM family methyltransferase